MSFTSSFHHKFSPSSRVFFCFCLYYTNSPESLFKFAFTSLILRSTDTPRFYVSQSYSFLSFSFPNFSICTFLSNTSLSLNIYISLTSLSSVQPFFLIFSFSYVTNLFKLYLFNHFQQFPVFLFCFSYLSLKFAMLFFSTSVFISLSSFSPLPIKH